MTLTERLALLDEDAGPLIVGTDDEVKENRTPYSSHVTHASLHRRLKELASAPNFKTYKEAMAWVKQRTKQVPHFTATPEYREVYPLLKKLAKDEKRASEADARKKNYTVWVEPRNGVFQLRLPYAGDGYNPAYVATIRPGLFGGSSLTFKTKDEALKYAKGKGYVVIQMDLKDRWVKLWADEEKRRSMS